MKKLVLRERNGNAVVSEIVVATAVHPDTVEALWLLHERLQQQLTNWDQEFVTLSDNVAFDLVDAESDVPNPEKREQ